MLMEQKQSESFHILRAAFIADSINEQKSRAAEDVIPDKFKKDFIQNGQMSERDSMFKNIGDRSGRLVTDTDIVDQEMFVDNQTSLIRGSEKDFKEPTKLSTVL